MQTMGWRSTVKLALIALTVTINGCDADKSETEPKSTGGSTAKPQGGGTSRGGSSAGGATSGGKANSGGSTALVGGSTATAGGNANVGGQSSVVGGGGTTGTAGASASCNGNAECAGNSKDKLCSVPTHECVECLTPSDCVPGGSGSSGTAGAAGAAGGPNLSSFGCVKNKCVNYTTCVNSLACPSGQVCSSSLGRCVQCVSDSDCPTGNKCGSNQCRPSCSSDNQCTPLGLLCNTTLGYCVSCNTTADCAADHFCSSGECQRDVCVGGSTKCQGTGISTCFTDGSGWGTPIACASSRTCAMSNGTAVCQPWVCTPSTTACAATEEKVITCSADGLTATTKTDCSATNQVCVAGACKDKICTAGARFCDTATNTVRTCSAKGDSSVLYSTCSSTQYCNSTTLACTARVCTPNAAGCNGNIAGTCNADGSGWLAGGVDCASGGSGQVCAPATGTCQSQLCTPSSYFCDTASSPNRVMLCASTGLTATAYTTCSTGYYCNASGTSTIPSCTAQICTPGQPTCDTANNTATTCNALGSGYVAGGTNCSTTSQICASGTCQTLACAPNTYFCDNRVGAPPALRLCSSTGMSSTIYATTTPSNYCSVAAPTTTYPSSWYAAKVCTPGTPMCNGPVATTCNATGSGPETTGGTDCSASTTTPYCFLGACQAEAVCSVTSTLFCDNSVTPSTIRSCSTGSPTTSSSCTAAQYCSSTGTPTCTTKVCTPGQPTCSSPSAAATCNATGSGYVGTPTDCGTTATCAAGACGTFTVDSTYTPGTTDSYYNYYYHASLVNYYTVTTSRKLVQIEQALYSFAAGTNFVWAVYESATQSGTYTPVWVGASTPSALSGWISSGPISNVTLKAGYYYAISLTWSTASSYVYYQLRYSSTYFPATLSFGTLTSGYTSSTPTYPASSLSYYSSYYYESPQRLTTTAP